MITQVRTETQLNRDSDNSLLPSILKEQAEEISKKIRNKFSQEGITADVTYVISGAQIEFHIGVIQNNKSKSIPISITNGRINVPKQLQKYLSNNGRTLEYNKIESILKSL